MKRLFHKVQLIDLFMYPYLTFEKTNKCDLFYYHKFKRVNFGKGNTKYIPFQLFIISKHILIQFLPSSLSKERERGWG